MVPTPSVRTALAEATLKKRNAVFLILPGLSKGTATLEAVSKTQDFLVRRHTLQGLGFLKSRAQLRNFFRCRRPVGLAGIAMEDQRFGLQFVVEFLAGQVDRLVVIIRASRLEIYAVSHATLILPVRGCAHRSPLGRPEAVTALS